MTLLLFFAYNNLMKKIFLLIAVFCSFPLWAEVSCKATYDEMGVTHQEIESIKDYYYCFGYHHGKDRAWQMDYFRRFALGLNAEVLGHSQIKNDFIMRLLNIEGLAKKIYQDFPAEYKSLLEYYSQGVNAGFETGKKSDEFIQLGFEPLPWQPIDSLYVLLLQSFDQTKKTFFFDVKEQESMALYPDAQELFNEDRAPWITTILKDGEYKKRQDPVKSTALERKPLKLWANFPELFGKNSGSNNWVINKRQTKHQHAILANDPHLDLKTPLFWYWIHLKGKDHNVVGASLPGLPFIASGTNGKLSWGLTNSYLNAADAVEITDLDKSEVVTSRPIIWFKFGFLKLPFFFKTISTFKDIYPILPLELDQRESIVLRWTGYYLKASEVTPLLNLFKVNSVEEAGKLLTSVGVPSWNYVLADRDGEIGYQMVGKTFQNEIDPFGVQRLSTQEFLHPLVLTGVNRPHLFDSQRNYVVTANNKHWPADSLYKGGGAYALSFRAHRIEEKVKQTNKHTLETSQEIQCDQLVTDAQFFVPLIQKYLPSFLENWNFISSDSSKEVGLYRRFMDLMMDEWELNETALYQVLQKLDQAKIKELTKLYAQAQKEVENRQWSHLSYLPFEHLSGDSDFEYSPVISGLGDEHTVGPGTTRWNKKKRMYEHYSGSSMRMIIEMSNPVKILLSLPGKNRDYHTKTQENPWNDWRACRYFQVAF